MDISNKSLPELKNLNQELKARMYDLMGQMKVTEVNLGVIGREIEKRLASPEMSKKVLSFKDK